jgi:uncharacterized protein YceK
MKKILLVIALFGVLISGCATKSVQHERVITQEKSLHHSGHRFESYMLGTRLGCSEKRVEWGFSKEACGKSWGKGLWIDRYKD